MKGCLSPWGDAPPGWSPIRQAWKVGQGRGLYSPNLTGLQPRRQRPEMVRRLVDDTTTRTRRNEIPGRGTGPARLREADHCSIILRLRGTAARSSIPPEIPRRDYGFPRRREPCSVKTRAACSRKKWRSEISARMRPVQNEFGFMLGLLNAARSILSAPCGAVQFIAAPWGRPRPGADPDLPERLPQNIKAASETRKPFNTPSKFWRNSIFFPISRPAPPV